MRPTALLAAALAAILLADRPALAGGRRRPVRYRVAAAPSPQWRPTAPYTAIPPRATYPIGFGLRRPYPPPFQPGGGVYRGTIYPMPAWSPFNQGGSYGNTFSGNLYSPNYGVGPFVYGW